MRAPVGDQRDSLGVEPLLELDKGIRHGACPHHDALLVVAHGCKDGSAAIERGPQKLELGGGCVLKLIKKHDRVREMQRFEDRWVFPDEQLDQSVKHWKRQKYILVTIVLGVPVLGDRALQFRAFIRNWQPRSCDCTLEVPISHTTKVMRIQKLPVISVDRHHNAVVSRRAIGLGDRRSESIHKTFRECVKRVGVEAPGLLRRTALCNSFRQIAGCVTLEADGEYAFGCRAQAGLEKIGRLLR